MNRYENGKIYKITDVGYNKCILEALVKVWVKKWKDIEHNIITTSKGKLKRRQPQYIYIQWVRYWEL
jgi:hypothetical protein